MRKYFKIITVVCLATTSSVAWAKDAVKEFKIDSSHSNIGFTTRHLVGRVNGEFSDVEGQFSFNADDLKNSKVKAIVKADSINTKETKRDAHLKGDEFFDVKKYPTLQFVSTQLTSAGDKKYKMTGDLTLHGVTKPVTFDVEYLGEAKDPWGNHRIGFAANSKINRKDFGIVWNKVLDSGGVMLGEEVDINLNIEGTQAVQDSAKKKH